ncbi:MAG: hypothetical protein HKN47_08465 [Pirellulaceae bacterium]|nr:hypothetical protein [Pirellulaceae bacterium]
MTQIAKPVELDPQGLQRVARVLRSASPAAVESILDRLTAEQSAAIGEAMASSAGVHDAAKETVCGEVINLDQHRSNHRAIRDASPPDSLPESDEPSFEFLGRVRQSTLFVAILRERPQTIAILLSAMPPRFAPGVIRALSEHRRIEVVARLAGLGEVAPAVVRDVVFGLQQRIEKICQSDSSAADGIQRVVRILQACDRETEWSTLRALGQDNPQLTEEIQQMLFDFEDIANLCDQQVQSIVRHIATETWAMALKRSSDEVRAKVFKNLTPRAAQHVRAEMSYLGEVLPSEIDRGQQCVIDVARRLSSDGDISRAA